MRENFMALEGLLTVNVSYFLLYHELLSLNSGLVMTPKLLLLENAVTAISPYVG